VGTFHKLCPSFFIPLALGSLFLPFFHKQGASLTFPLDRTTKPVLGLVGGGLIFWDYFQLGRVVEMCLLVWQRMTEQSTEMVGSN
jgi:hypothetical protein